MHMADVLVSTGVAGTMYLCSAAVTAHSVKKVQWEDSTKKIPMMGVMGAFVFAAQMINFTIPGTGSSGHLCGAMLLTAVLGPYASFLTMVGVLIIQSLLFADGGILALGCNIWNIAFYGCILGYFLFWRPIQKKGLSRKRIIIASVLGAAVTLQLGAFSVVLETQISQMLHMPFMVFLSVMQPIHLVIGLVEGMVTAAVLLFLYEAREEILAVDKDIQNKARFSAKRIIITLAVVTVITGAGLSLAASEYPDGLEWSLEKVTGESEPVVQGQKSHIIAEQVQEWTAILPDYGFQNNSSLLGTSFSGVAGSAAVLAACVGGCYIIRFFKRKKYV